MKKTNPTTKQLEAKIKARKDEMLTTSDGWERLVREAQLDLLKTIERVEEMKIKKKKGFMEMVFRDNKKAKIKVHENMDVGFNQALDQVLQLIKDKIKGGQNV